MATSGYEIANHMSYKVDPKNGLSLLANFTAEIVREVHYVGGGAADQTMLTLAGQKPDRDEEARLGPNVVVPPIQLPEVDVSADEFPNFNWVTHKWGSRCVLAPGGVKDDLRVMIQMQSKAPVLTVYKEIGWHKVGKQQVYIHAGGGISKSGNDPSISTALPMELQKFDLSSAAKLAPADCLRASLAMLDICEGNITWPLFAATLAPIYGPVDFAMHVTGRTGSFKSELISLYQSHYGPSLDARSLPCAWSSTGNAMEALAFIAKNAVLVVDDFVPQGTAYGVKALQATADRIIRAQGNQAGRARLSDISSMQTTLYPRGVIFSTGEDTPEGHSVRARMLIRELSAGDIEADNLTRCQNMRPLYCGTIAWLAQSLAGEPADLKPRMDEIRSQLRATGHSRTPGMIARLVTTLEDFFPRAARAGLISEAEASKYIDVGTMAILEAGNQQASYLEDSDPVDQFFAALRQIFASGGGHMRMLNGGIPRQNSEQLGWSVERSQHAMDAYKARGQCIGWIDPRKDDCYFDVTAGYPVVKKTLGADMQLSKQTLFKRLKDAGALKRVDAQRDRNTVRVTAEGSPRLVLQMSLQRVLQVEESSNDEEQDGDGAGSDRDDDATDEGS